jgi:hypothetical protein
MAEHDDVRLGMRVRDMSGELLGTVTRLGAGRFLVQHGTVVKESLIVPDQRVAAINDGEVALNCSHRDLLEAMRNPPMEEELARAEQYRYAEMEIPHRKAQPTPATSGPPDEVHPAPGKVRVVRDEISVHQGSAHEFEVRSTEEKDASEGAQPDPDRPLH